MILKIIDYIYIKIRNLSFWKLQSVEKLILSRIC